MGAGAGTQKARRKARRFASLAVPLAFLVGVLAPLPAAPAAAPDATAPSLPDTDPVLLADGLEVPANIDVAPDGSVWFAEVDGNVSRLTEGQVQRMHHVDVQTGGERGLVGMALAHDFGQSGAFYLYYTEPATDDGNGTNRLVRVEEGQETLLVAVPAAIEHNGGRILVTGNGTLFVGTGDNSLRDPAQDPESLLGKILRMTPEGDPVPGNMAGLVYSLGHRNVFGLAMHPETGGLWATENSGWRRDEVNRIHAGGNYGYPECEGRGLNGVDDPCPTDKGYTFPVLTFYEDRAAAPTGAVFWNGAFHWASLNEGSIHRIQQNGSTGDWSDRVVYQHDTPILDLGVGPDGALHFSALDAIWRFGAAKTAGQGGQMEVGEDTPGVGPVLGLAAVLMASALRRRAP